MIEGGSGLWSEKQIRYSSNSKKSPERGIENIIKVRKRNYEAGREENGLHNHYKRNRNSWSVVEKGNTRISLIIFCLYMDMAYAIWNGLTARKRARVN